MAEGPVDLNNWALQIGPFWESNHPTNNITLQALPNEEVKTFLENMDFLNSVENKNIILNYLNQTRYYAIVDYTILKYNPKWLDDEENQKNYKTIVQRCLQNSRKYQFVERIPMLWDDLRNGHPMLNYYYQYTNLFMECVMDNIFTSKNEKIKIKFKEFFGRKIKELGEEVTRLKKYNEKLRKTMRPRSRQRLIEIIERIRFLINQFVNTHRILFDKARKYEFDPIEPPNDYKNGLDLYKSIIFSKTGSLPQDLSKLVGSFMFGRRRRSRRKGRKRSKRKGKKRSKRKSRLKSKRRNHIM